MNMSLATTLLSIVLILLGYFSPVYREQILTMGLYSFSGAITNWIAVHMLFEKIPFLYGSGIITLKFHDFKIGIKNLMMNQFFNEENLNKFLSDSLGKGAGLDKEVIFEKIPFDEIFDKLKEAILQSQFGSMINMFGGPAALDPLRPNFTLKLKEIIDEYFINGNLLSELTNSSGQDSILHNVEEIVDQRLNELTPVMVKNIIEEMIRSHLGWLVVWGGVFGALIGLISTFII